MNAVTHTPVNKLQDARDGLRRIGAEHDAMKMALDLIAAGVARIERLSPEVSEFCFQGLRYCRNTTAPWSDTIGAIGWQRCVSALAGKGVG